MNVAIQQPFDEPWQARAFALVVELLDHGCFTPTQWSEALAAQISTDPGRPYYACWLTALETLSTARGALSVEEVDERQVAWLQAAARTPHGTPITLDAR